MIPECAAGADEQGPRPQRYDAEWQRQRRQEASAQYAIDRAILGSEGEIASDRPRRVPANGDDVVSQMERHRARRRARRIVERRRSAGLR